MENVGSPPFDITSPFFLAVARTQPYLWGMATTMAVLLPLIIHLINQPLPEDGFKCFFNGIFFGMNCCGSEVLVVLLLSMLRLLYVATACTANFHTVSHVKSLLTSADKFSRACSPALTEQRQESGS